MVGNDAKKARRSISDQEISLIKAMLKRGMEKTTIQAYFTHPDRPVNYGRITNIEQGDYGPDIISAGDEELDKFLSEWRTREDFVPQNLAETLLDFASLSAVHPKRLEALFEIENGSHVLRGVETDEVECKLTFQRPGNDRLLRAVAALANNRGGYVLFGVEDHTGLLKGLKDDRFSNNDPSKFAQAFKSAMEPCPRFELGEVALNGVTMGAVYVHAELDGPVIATRDEDSFKAGVVYYRYPGESRAIHPADFRRMLAARDQRARHEAANLAKKVIELGGDAAVLDLKNGRIDNRAGPIYMSPDLLSKLHLVREGKFVQKEGAATLRLVGDVEVAQGSSENLIRERIVRTAIKDSDVLRNFIEQAEVKFPAEYVLHSCHSNKHWLPIFYYLSSAGLSEAEIVSAVKVEEGASPSARGRLMDRIKGRMTAKTTPSMGSRSIIASILDGSLEQPKTLGDVRKHANAIQGWSDKNFSLQKLLSILASLRQKAKELSSDDNGLTEIRRAAAWLDELFFKRS